MVDYPVLLIETAKAIPTVGTIDKHILIAEAESHIPYYDIVGLDSHWIVCYANAISRSCLSCNGDIADSDVECRFKMNGARYIKHDGLYTSLAECSSESTHRTVVGK